MDALLRDWAHVCCRVTRVRSKQCFRATRSNNVLAVHMIKPLVYGDREYSNCCHVEFDKTTGES